MASGEQHKPDSGKGKKTLSPAGVPNAMDASSLQKMINVHRDDICSKIDSPN